MTKKEVQNKMLKIAFLGPSASFSNDAAARVFPEDELVPAGTIKEVFEFVDLSKTDFGVIPLENSTEGSVTQTLDMLAGTKLFIIGEVFLKIKQCLLSNESASKIKKIYSHPQGFAQCREWLSNNYPKAELIECSSTAKAAEKAASEKYSGAIASESAAKKFGLLILKENIQDSVENRTRFGVLARDIEAKISSSSNSPKTKTSILFGVKHAPGSLFDAIKSFKDFGVNMTKIESRPSKKNAWEYVFFVDVEGFVNDKNVALAMAELKKHCEFVKILGSYSRIE
jgi:chorismate mutase/prephenate dehydratase